MSQAVLRTRRITLVPLADAHLDDEVALDADPEVMRRELIRHGFADLGLDRIFAETMAVNEGSRATMASVGLRYVRTFHLAWDHPLPGTEHGEVRYAITREQWSTGTSRAPG